MKPGLFSGSTGLPLDMGVGPPIKGKGLFSGRLLRSFQGAEFTPQKRQESYADYQKRRQEHHEKMEPEAGCLSPKNAKVYNWLVVTQRFFMFTPIWGIWGRFSI